MVKNTISSRWHISDTHTQIKDTWKELDYEHFEELLTGWVIISENCCTWWMWCTLQCWQQWSNEHSHTWRSGFVNHIIYIYSSKGTVVQIRSNVVAGPLGIVAVMHVAKSMVWCSVMFIDKSRFHLHVCNAHLTVQCRPGEWYLSECMCPWYRNPTHASCCSML